jgi:purine-nucleoside phosphorylase
MIEAPARTQQADLENRRLPVRLVVATWPEALPLLRFRPAVIGMGRKAASVARLGHGPILSAGFAGACRADLGVGRVVIGGDATAALQARLNAAEGEIRTLDHIASPKEKAELGRLGVAAVDMETARLAEAAAGARFLSVRVVIDRIDEPAIGLATATHYLAACRALRQAVRRALEVWP